ncbi:MAG: DUF4139 domain-containing protein [candidate division Zixibacteria bacterium]|nr:DUF4139 domain-containing protein [candidate division Zixibacteria bacterium]
MKRKSISLILLIILIGASAGYGGDIAITIYNSNLGLVKDVRQLEFKKGVNFLDFDEVASQIDATSVNFSCLDNKNVAVLEQNYLYDLVSTEALLKRYIGLNIEIIAEDDRIYQGKLLSYDNSNSVFGGTEGNVILSDEDGQVLMVALSKVADCKFPSLPEGLILKPTLRWQIDSPSKGAKKCEVSYLTGGINWQADYVAVVSAKDDKLDLAGWVTINNTSGATYENAKMKLVAGDIHRVTERGRGEMDMVSYAAPMAKGARRPQFEEEAFFEYHLYTLNRPATLNDREIKQLSLFPTTEAKVKKVYIFDASQSGYRRNQDDKVKIKVNLEFENSEKAGLGMPFPKGKLRVYKEDSQKALQFVGEDLIDHTPKDEKVRVYLGDAFDITGTRKQVNIEDLGGDRRRETFEIKLKNHKDDDVMVTVVEHPRGWREWEIKNSSHPYKKIDNHRIEFEIDVNSDGEEILNYTIQYN